MSHELGLLDVGNDEQRVGVVMNVERGSSTTDDASLTSGQLTKLTDLMPDLVCQICHQLSPRDIVRLACTSRHFRNVATQNLAWRHHLPPGLIPEGASPYRLACAILETRATHDSRLFAGQSRLFFTEYGDVRPGKVRKSISPGNHTVAHFRGEQESENTHWTLFQSPEAPGWTFLQLSNICWLDVQNVFRGLPAGGYVFSWHLKLPKNALDLRAFEFAQERHLQFTISTLQGEGTPGRTVNFGAPFNRPVTIPDKWIRFDVYMEVLSSEETVILSVHDKRGTWKSGIAFGMVEAVKDSRVGRPKPYPISAVVSCCEEDSKGYEIVLYYKMRIANPRVAT